MKKFIVLFTLLVLLGGLLIFLPLFLSSNMYEQNNKEVAAYQVNQNEIMQNISSNLNTINNSINTLKSQTTYDPEQMFFENIDSLYKYFTFNQVEYIKQKIQSYVHTYVSKSILDCSIVIDSIHQDNNNISFLLNIININNFEVDVSKQTNTSYVDITMLVTN